MDGIKGSDKMSKDPIDEYDHYEDVARDIRNMKIRGAGKIARMGAYGLALYARRYTGGENEFYSGLVEAARTIFETRPTAVSLENALILVLNSIDADNPFEKMQRQTEKNVLEFMEDAVRGLERLAGFGAELIKDGYTIHTHCNSSAAINSIARAHEQGKDVTVYSTESRPRYQGRITVGQLTEKGIKAYMLVDSAARLYMDDVDIVMVGADTIAADGSLYNKIGTHGVALAAKDCGVSFYTCAETFKFSPRTLAGYETIIEMREAREIADPAEFPGVTILNPAFDHTPSDMITGIVTERGVIRPGEVMNTIREIFCKKNVDYFY